MRIRCSTSCRPTRVRRSAPTVAPGVALATVLGLLAVPGLSVVAVAVLDILVVHILDLLLGVFAVAVLGPLFVLVLRLLFGVFAVRVLLAVLGVLEEGSSFADEESILRRNTSSCSHCTTPPLVHVTVECFQMTTLTHPVLPSDVLVERIKPGRRTYGVQLMCVAPGAVCLVPPSDVTHCTHRRIPRQVAGVVSK